mmetsp:Transcript_20452/g.43213  ORF Transcript_20452/g.43213 Transcript_20452/m.43213 type:complete len:210 (+) Transcript_20452:575-1204(+)
MPCASTPPHAPLKALETTLFRRFRCSERPILCIEPSCASRSACVRFDGATLRSQPSLLSLPQPAGSPPFSSSSSEAETCRPCPRQAGSSTPGLCLARGASACQSQRCDRWQLHCSCSHPYSRRCSVCVRAWERAPRSEKLRRWQSARRPAHSAASCVALALCVLSSTVAQQWRPPPPPSPLSSPLSPLSSPPSPPPLLSECAPLARQSR